MRYIIAVTDHRGYPHRAFHSVKAETLAFAKMLARTGACRDITVYQDTDIIYEWKDH